LRRAHMRGPLLLLVVLAPASALRVDQVRGRGQVRTPQPVAFDPAVGDAAKDAAVVAAKSTDKLLSVAKDMGIEWPTMGVMFGSLVKGLGDLIKVTTNTIKEFKSFIVEVRPASDAVAGFFGNLTENLVARARAGAGAGTGFFSNITENLGAGMDMFANLTKNLEENLFAEAATKAMEVPDKAEAAEAAKEATAAKTEEAQPKGWLQNFRKKKRSTPQAKEATAAKTEGAQPNWWGKWRSRTR